MTLLSHGGRFVIQTSQGYLLCVSGCIFLVFAFLELFANKELK